MLYSLPVAYVRPVITDKGKNYAVCTADGTQLVQDSGRVESRIGPAEFGQRRRHLRGGLPGCRGGRRRSRARGTGCCVMNK